MAVMHMFENGVQASLIPEVTWRKSRRSNADGNCVELAVLPDGRVGIRNSRFPDGPALVVERDGVSAFVAGAQAGEFDALTDKIG
jgi:hypothetical protein